MCTNRATILEHCASKQDLARVEARIDNLEVRMTAAIEKAKSELMRWVVTVGILQMALIAGLVLKLA